MKAQFDSLSHLFKECTGHFEKSMGLVTMSDEDLQRHYISQFKTEWKELEELLQGKEKELQRLRIQTVPVPQLLQETQDTLASIEVALKEVDTQVTSIQQLRDISEKYKILRIKILNSRDNLEHLREVTGIGESAGKEDEQIQEQLGQLTSTCQELVCNIGQRITSLECVLDQVQRAVRRVECISLTMMHLEFTLNRCKAADKEGEQLLRAALHSCKAIKEGLEKAGIDISKVRESVELVKRDPHHPCHLSELDDKVAQLQDELRSLSHSIEETRTNLKDRLDAWHKFKSSSEAVDVYLQEIELLVDSAINLPSVNLQGLQQHLEELQNLQSSMVDREEELLNKLRTEAVYVEKTECIETQITKWNSVCDRLVKVRFNSVTCLLLSVSKSKIFMQTYLCISFHNELLTCNNLIFHNA